MKSILSQAVIHKLEALPTAIQQEVLDYIDFLIEKYQIEISETDQDDQNRLPAPPTEQPTVRLHPQSLEFW